MEPTTTLIAQEDIDRQLDFCRQITTITHQWPQRPLAFVDTFGCQQNEADSERIRGYLAQMGYGIAASAEEARIVVINTCAIREHAEQRVFGNVGALIHSKRRNPEQLICLCGCMMQQAHVAEKIRLSYRHVDLVFGPHALWKFPQMVHTLLTQRGRIFQIQPESGSIAEGLPVVRQEGVKAWVSIMYGCNNFCAYCIVPYVRGRERSRKAADILTEVAQLVAQGYKDITLLGQNVNSYGKDFATPMDFATLLEQVNALEGDFILRFMTSHPKDATQALFESMARCEKVAPVLHLPVQAGNNRVLQAMNRRHTREEYLEKIAALKALIPHIVLTSDIIVGFPGETAAEFEDTLTLLEQVGFDALFTFIFSPRVGTPAAQMDDPLSREEKMVSFNRMSALQDTISEQKHAAYVGTQMRCLIDGVSDDLRWPLTARSPGNRLVHVVGDAQSVGQFKQVRITDANKWSLFGELV